MPTRRLILAALPAAFAGLAKAAPSRPVVTMFGDSITAGYGLPAADALPAQLEAELRRLRVSVQVRGAGISGDTTAGGLARVEFSVQSDTRVCVVELGGNDLLQGIEPDQTKTNLDQIVRRLKARGIRVVLAGGKAPARGFGDYGRAFDQVFPAVAKANAVPLAPDLMAGVSDHADLKQRDGLHPNSAGVKIIAKRLAPIVARVLNP